MKLAREIDDEFFKCLTATERAILVRLLTKEATKNQISRATKGELDEPLEIRFRK